MVLSSWATTKTVDGTRCLWSHTDLGSESSLADCHWAGSWACPVYNVQQSDPFPDSHHHSRVLQWKVRSVDRSVSMKVPTAHKAAELGFAQGSVGAFPTVAWPPGAQ